MGTEAAKYVVMMLGICKHSLLTAVVLSVKSKVKRSERKRERMRVKYEKRELQK